MSVGGRQMAGGPRPPTPYPPGVPVIGPGEEITAELVAYLIEAGRRGLAIQGPQDPTLATLRVVAGDPRVGPAP